MSLRRALALSLMALALAACSSAPKKSAPPPGSGKAAAAKPSKPAHVATGCPATSPYAPAQEDTSKRGDYKAGGLYAPHIADTTPDYIPNVDCIPEPVVSDEPRSPIGNRTPYSVLGKQYKVLDDVSGYVERGTASYYGNKFHGRRTSNHEVYDMYAFTAAHKSLPLPSFARVTNLDNGQSVVVRVNDRGPFHDGRVIDLSYAAAVKLGITARGTGRVEVKALTPADADTRSAKAAKAPPTAARTTEMDRLVGALPANSAARVAVPVAARAGQVTMAATVSEDERWRYRVTPDMSQPASAEKFDAWMRAQGVHVATGKPTRLESSSTDGRRVAVESRKPGRTKRTPAEVPTVAAAKSPAATMTDATALAPAQESSAVATREAGALEQLLLQVASFASRENANRALAQLSSAGIACSLSDVQSNGRTMWRLRVRPHSGADVAELAGRIASLGFGQPQWVKE